MNHPDLKQVKEYFERHIQAHGATPQGVDWNSPAAQEIRYDQLLKVIEQPRFRLLDYGCGYGMLAGYLQAKGYECEYIGYDLVEASLEIAREMYQGTPGRTFISSLEGLEPVDYVVASGIFNYREDIPDDTWLQHILDTLHEMDRLSTAGFASNFLTSYSDPEYMRPTLYYANPGWLFDYCKRHFSKNVALLHDYKIYDFTLIIRKG